MNLIKGFAMYNLFPDQIKAVNEAIDFLRDGYNTLLYSPVGSGKTVMGSEIVLRMGKKTIFLVNKKTLVSQTYEKLHHHGVKVAVFHNTIYKTVDGTVMSDDVDNCDVIISLIESYENGNLNFEPELIVLDECHKSTSEGYQEFRAKFPKALILGLSATPGRLQNKEGEALSEWYEKMARGESVKYLMDNKRLANAVYKIYDQNTHVVQTWHQLTKGQENRRTIVFARDARHMIALKKSFVDNGVVAEYVCSGSDLEDIKDEISVTTDNQRNEIFKKFNTGEIEVLISFGILCEGFDEQLAKYCFLVRKVSHVALFHQMIGRVLRIHPTKPEGFICDFCGNVEEFGPIEEYVWEMDGSGSKQCLVLKNGTKIAIGHYNRREKIFVCCDDCSHVYDVMDHDNCPCCNFKNHIEVTANFERMRKFFYAEVNQEGWAEFLRRAKKFNDSSELQLFWEFFAIAKRAIEMNRTADFNNMYFEIFDGNVFIKKFRWMETLMNLDPKKVTNETRISYKV